MTTEIFYGKYEVCDTSRWRYYAHYDTKVTEVEAWVNDLVEALHEGIWRTHLPSR